MKPAETQVLARELLNAHGLHDWGIRFDHARRRAAQCIHSRRTISFSIPLTSLYDRATVRDIVLHEIAHARVGASHRHDDTWRREARRLGASDSPRLSSSLPQPQAPWVGSCPTCGNKRELYRAPRRVISCRSCSPQFDTTHIFQWTHKGVPSQPGGAYSKEMRRLSRRRTLHTEHRVPIQLLGI